MAGKLSAPPAPIDTQNNYTKKKQDMEKAFREFHDIFSNKVLDKNKSVAVKNTEKAIVDRLVNSCVALENLNVGEGFMALAVISLREQLTMRDRLNELEYELCKTLKALRSAEKKDEPKKP
ncbi:MAG: hypothetical protein WC523_04035 [Patescibacteria group bacterium]